MVTDAWDGWASLALQMQLGGAVGPMSALMPFPIYLNSAHAHVAHTAARRQPRPALPCLPHCPADYEECPPQPSPGDPAACQLELLRCLAEEAPMEHPAWAGLGDGSELVAESFRLSFAECAARGKHGVVCVCVCELGRAGTPALCLCCARAAHACVPAAC